LKETYNEKEIKELTADSFNVFDKNLDQILENS
jgi:hypothetical protein